MKNSRHDISAIDVSLVADWMLASVPKASAGVGVFCSYLLYMPQPVSIKPTAAMAMIFLHFIIHTSYLLFTFHFCRRALELLVQILEHDEEGWNDEE